MRKTLTAALLGTALAFTTGQGFAEQAAPAKPQAKEAPQAQQQNVKTDFSEKQLKAFISISQEINSVRQDFQKKFQQAGDQQSKRQVQQEAQKAMVEVIKKSPIDMKVFNQIAKAYQASPEVRKKVNKMAGSSDS